MERVFIYWDNSNIFHEAQRLAADCEQGPDALFVALDDFYEGITFLEPSKPGFELATPRNAAPLDLSRRRV